MKNSEIPKFKDAKVAVSNPNILRSLRHSQQLIDNKRIKQRYIQQNNLSFFSQVYKKNILKAYAAASPSQPQEEPSQIRVFPRYKEKDPYKVLAVTPDADFEEIQGAHQYLLEQYRSHGDSKDTIELAYDHILSERQKIRQKYGFQPKKRNLKKDKQAEIKKTFQERVKEQFDPSVTRVIVLNEGFVHLFLTLWATYMIQFTEATVPIFIQLVYAIYKLYQKRKIQNPDGPYLFKNPLPTAILKIVGGLILGSIIGGIISQVINLPLGITELPGTFLGCSMIYFVQVFMR